MPKQTRPVTVTKLISLEFEFSATFLPDGSCDAMWQEIGPKKRSQTLISGLPLSDVNDIERQLRAEYEKTLEPETP